MVDGVELLQEHQSLAGSGTYPKDQYREILAFEPYTSQHVVYIIYI